MIYQSRPDICREYGTDPDDPCEYFTDDLANELLFDSDAAFDSWLRVRRERTQQRKARQKGRKQKSQ